MFIWAKIKGSNPVNFFSTLWKSAKSFSLAHCRNSLSSMPGKLHASILKDMLNRSLGGGGGKEIFILFDQPFIQVSPRFVLVYDSKCIRLHLASVIWWPKLLLHKVYVAAMASANFFVCFWSQNHVDFFKDLVFNVFSTPVNPAMKYKHIERHELARNDTKSIVLRRGPEYDGVLTQEQSETLPSSSLSAFTFTLNTSCGIYYFAPN